MDYLNKNIAVTNGVPTGSPAVDLYPWMSVKAGTTSYFSEIRMKGPIYDQNNQIITGGGGGGGNLPIAVLWQPSGTIVDPAVVTGNCSVLAQYLIDNPQICTIYIDNTFAECDVDVELNLDYRIAIEGRYGAVSNGSPFSIVNLTGDGQLKNPIQLKYLLIQNINVMNNPMISIEARSSNQNLLIESCRIQASNSTFPIISVNNATPNQCNQVLAFSIGSIGVNLQPTVPAIDVSANVQLFCVFVNSSQDYTNTGSVFGGAGNIIYGSDSNNFTGQPLAADTQSLVTGSFTKLLVSQASLVNKVNTDSFASSPTVDAWLEKLKGGYVGQSNITSASDSQILVYKTPANEWVNTSMNCLRVSMNNPSNLDTTANGTTLILGNYNQDFIYGSNIALSGSQVIVSNQQDALYQVSLIVDGSSLGTVEQYNILINKNGVPDIVEMLMNMPASGYASVSGTFLVKIDTNTETFDITVVSSAHTFRLFAAKWSFVQVKA